MFVRLASAPELGSGAIAAQNGGTTLGSARLQHGVLQTKGLGCSGALPPKPQWPAFACGLHGYRVLRTHRNYLPGKYANGMKRMVDHAKSIDLMTEAQAK